MKGDRMKRILLILITCAVNVVFGILCLIIVSRLFNNEKIVNE